MKIARIRPQVLAGIVILGLLGLTAIPYGHLEITTGCVIGVVAIIKELIGD